MPTSEDTTPSALPQERSAARSTRRAQLRAGAVVGAAALLGRTQSASAASGVLRVDAHAHALTPTYRRALSAAGVRSPTGMAFPSWSEQSALSFMWRYGIRAQVLSISDPGVEFLDVAESVVLARRLNDELADLIRRRPDRFAALAVLPGRDAAASVAEIRRALDEGKLDGVGLLSNYDGEYLGAPRFEPILAELDARAAYVFVHPTQPSDGARPPGGLPDPILEFPFETTRAIDSLLRADLLRRYPRIRWHLAHAGGVVPALVDRLGRDLAYDPAPVLSTLRYDTALASSSQAMAGVRAVAPVEHVLFATDWPFTGALFLTLGTPQGELRDSFSGDDLTGVLSKNILRELPRLARALGVSS